MRKILPVALIVASALLVTGCTAGNDSTSAADGCKTSVASGKASDSIKVNSKKDAEPTVKFSSPLKVKKVERTILKKGKGPVAKKATTVDIKMVAYNGTTGKKLTSNGYGTGADAVAIPITVGDSSMIPVLTDLVKCSTIGSRVVAAAPVKGAFGKADPSSLGLTDKDTIVFVADLVDVVPQKADGKAQEPKADFPKVSLGKSGKPTVTIPKTDPPKKTEVEVLKKGTGDVVKDGDSIIAQYQGTNWRTGKVFDQSWGNAPATLSMSGVVKGFSKGLVGQTVGSQVVILIPPADGFGKDGSSKAGIKGTDSLVFVVDILKIAG